MTFDGREEVWLDRNDLLPFMHRLVTAWLAELDGSELKIEVVPMTNATWTYRVIRDNGVRLLEEEERAVFLAICKTHVPLAPR